MRNPVNVLDNLASKSRESEYKFHRLYRNLYNPEFYLNAYAKIYANDGSMTKGIDEGTIDGMSLEKINNIIQKMKDESYRPNPVRRTYIPKSNGKTRPLGIPSFEDKLVQEVIRVILESIYEGRFSNDSHGFRPNRSCHTALNQVRETFTGVKWFVEGDIKGFFDNIDHHVLIQILRRNIDDEKFIRLIWKFLRAGYMENWVYHNTYSGTPQGGNLSPLLSSIYLNELDSYVCEFKKSFDRGKTRRLNSDHKRLTSKYQRRVEKLREKGDELSTEEKEHLIAEIKELDKQRRNFSYTDPMDEGYKRLQYTRYADDFLIGIIGSKQDAIEVKRVLTNFLADKLKLELSQEKTLITNSSKTAKFLGYEVAITRENSTVKRKGDGAKVRSRQLRCQLYLPKEKWVNKLLKLGALGIDKNNNWKPEHRTQLKDHDDLEIISIYNAEIERFYNYYKLAKNVSVLTNFKYFMQYSMYKTFANKYKTSMSQIITRFNIDGNFGVKYETKSGPKIRFFYDKGFKKTELSKDESTTIDVLPNTRIYNGRSSLVDRLLAGECEWCGATGASIEMHHVRKLKDLKGKAQWEQRMIARRRKTLALCKDCHDSLHAGKLD